MIRRRLAGNNDAWIPSAIPFFLIGFVYYLVSPALVFRFLSKDNELLDAATKYVSPDYFNFLYLLDAIAILVSFLLGYFLAKHVTRAKVSSADCGSHQQSVPKHIGHKLWRVDRVFRAYCQHVGGQCFLRVTAHITSWSLARCRLALSYPHGLLTISLASSSEWCSSHVLPFAPSCSWGGDQECSSS